MHTKLISQIVALTNRPNSMPDISVRTPTEIVYAAARFGIAYAHNSHIRRMSPAHFSHSRNISRRRAQRLTRRQTSS